MNAFLAVALLATLALCPLAVQAQEKADAVPKPVEKAPVSYGLVVDNSGSFRLLLDRVIAVVSDVVEENGADDEAFLLTFVNSSKIFVRQEFTDSRSELQDAAENMFIEGGQTAILDAMMTAADYLQKNARSDDGRKRALVLITDGEDRESEATIDDVLKRLKEHNIRVIVIAMSAEKVFAKIPGRLTKETGGVMLSPKTKVELTAAAKEVSAAMRAK